MAAGYFFQIYFEYLKCKYFSFGSPEYEDKFEIEKNIFTISVQILALLSFNVGNEKEKKKKKWQC